MALRRLFVREDETLEDAQRREDIEAPFGRCGEFADDINYGGCGTPLIGDDMLVCPDFPDCCRP